jgi:outer membrane protein
MEGGTVVKIKIALLASILTIFVFTGLSLGADVAKIGIIDAQKILETSSAGKAARKKLKENYDNMRAELEGKAAEIEDLKKQLQREAMVMSQEKREEKERELRIKTEDLESLRQKYTRQMQQMEKNLVSLVQKDILAISETMGKQEGYLLIMNTTNVVYSPQSIDITDQVIEKYNEKFAKGDTEVSKAE